MGLLQAVLPGSTVVIGIDPRTLSNRVWLSTGEAGEVVPPMSLPVLRPGLERLHRRWLAEGLDGGSDPADLLCPAATSTPPQHDTPAWSAGPPTDPHGG